MKQIWLVFNKKGKEKKINMELEKRNNTRSSDL